MEHGNTHIRVCPFFHFRDVIHNDPPADDAPLAPMLPHPGEAIDIPTMDGAEAFHCELDDYAVLIEEMKKAGIVGPHKVGTCFGKTIEASLWQICLELYFLLKPARRRRRR